MSEELGEINSRSPLEIETGRRYFRAVEAVWVQMWHAINQLNGWPNKQVAQGIPKFEEAEESLMPGWRLLSLESWRFRPDYEPLLKAAAEGGGLVEVQTKEEWEALRVLEDESFL
jgi:hypothetical protein